MASNEAFKKQAEGASAAAKKYMEDNELLQEVSVTIIIIPRTHQYTKHTLMDSTCKESSSGLPHLRGFFSYTYLKVL